jgi:hypothetical protein
MKDIMVALVVCLLLGWWASPCIAQSGHKSPTRTIKAVPPKKSERLTRKDFDEINLALEKGNAEAIQRCGELRSATNNETGELCKMNIRLIGIETLLTSVAS